jgi:hypothetical protein
LRHGGGPGPVCALLAQRLADSSSLAGMAPCSGWRKRKDRRADPQTLWPEARSVIVLAMNYGPDRDPLENLAQPLNASISVYARNRDYHDIIKGRLKELAGKFAARAGGDVKVFVDTAPVMEKPLAQAAGLGWIGKHTNLVSRNHGSWLFWPRSSPRSSWRRMPPRRIIAAHVGPVFQPARRTRFPLPTRLMRGAAFPISPSRTRVPIPA